MLNVPGVDRKITMGNIVTICVVILTWAISGIIWYGDVDSHIKDHSIHSSLLDRQHETDERVHLLTDPALAETNRRLLNIEAATAENTKLLHDIKGQLEAR